ncbi:hypothetical protein BUALT_Bualt05G0109700 [Buddleja alternifolia]|uniref:EF-hand domain-containing protein n=1 Tax=Buddleja alternifolia TaxID=168488 RepID=A0AAV6XJS4_9LAMI|nr:hypothetical protein BUALT_Bualt05G0109700 [Buddleja alternifolia]
MAWAIVDTKQQGFLGFKEFITAMQLIYLAREGHEISSKLLKRIGDSEIPSPPNIYDLVVLLENRRTHVQVAILKPMMSSDFDAKTMVLLLGQYSTGKTTFIKHLLQCSYPGAHIVPEPTTDRFIVIMSATEERSILGNTITVHADMPFSGLDTFGRSLLSKFECSQMPHSLLKHITFVDITRVSSGERQRSQMNNDFTGVINAMLPSSSSLIPLKLTSTMSSKGSFHHFVVMMTKSFIDKPVNEAHVGPVQNDFFEKEQEALLLDLIDIPKKACRRFQSRYKIDDFENLNSKMIQTIDDMLQYDISQLLKNFRNLED